MAYGGLNKQMDAAAGIGRNPVSTRFSLRMDNERADAERDGRTRLARSNSQARTRTGKYSCFPVQLTTSGIGNLIRLIHTLLYVMTIHMTPITVYFVAKK